MIFFKLRRFDMKYLIITLLLLPTYSFTQDDSIEPQKYVKYIHSNLTIEKLISKRHLEKNLVKRRCFMDYSTNT